MKPLDFIGERFGSWTILSLMPPCTGPQRGYYFKCKCDCGNERVVSKRNLTRKTGKPSRMCGSCATIKRNTTHGMTNTREYKSWDAMIQRCTNPQATKYYNYGGSGISVCTKWMTFEGFYEDMGPRPEDMTLDRIDSDGNYELNNCRWADIYMQNNNIWR